MERRLHRPAVVHWLIISLGHHHRPCGRRPRCHERRLLQHDLANPLLGRHGRDHALPGRLIQSGRRGLEAANGVGARGGAQQRAAAPAPDRERRRRRAGRSVRGTPSACRRRVRGAAGGGGEHDVIAGGKLTS
jgi:hypothetical protein